MYEKKKLTCTISSSFSQFLTFYYCCTIYTSTYNFECINFPYHLFVLFEWMCGVEIAVVRHGMKISTVVAMDADLRFFFFSFFFHLTKKTGLQVHPTTDMHFTESREEEKKKRNKWHKTLLECLFLLRFDKCCEENNVVCQLDFKRKRWRMDGGDE